MKLAGRHLAVFITVLGFLIQGSYCIQITASGGGNGESGSVSMNFDTLASTAVTSQIAINGADLTHSTAISGSVTKFEETHSIKDASGKSASVYVKVVNAPNGLTYSSKVLPKEGSISKQSQVSAEQWLTVPKADSIKCTATSSYGILSVNIDLEEAKSAAAGDYVTLTGYYGKAVTTGTLVLASQTATSGAANSIKIYGTSKDSSGTYNINTPLKGISGGKATFSGLSETASAGTTTQVVQKEHVHGTFTSTAKGTRTTPEATKTITRTSNYGTEYDLNMVAKKTTSGPAVYGTLGYYVNPTLMIQGAVNAAQSGDAINVAAGTFKENVKIDKSLTVKGAGATNTIVNGNKAGSVFAIGMKDPNVDVALSGMTATNGNANDGGGIVNRGKLTLTGVSLTDNAANNGGGICNIFGSVIMNSGSITRNIANNGGGICNFYGTVNLKGGSITGNTANNLGGGIYSGGICNSDTVTLKIDGTQVVVKFNKAGQPLHSELSWHQGWGIYLNTGTPTITGGFDPATQVTDNTLI